MVEIDLRRQMMAARASAAPDRAPFDQTQSEATTGKRTLKVAPSPASDSIDSRPW